MKCNVGQNYGLPPDIPLHTSFCYCGEKWNCFLKQQTLVWTQLVPALTTDLLDWREGGRDECCHHICCNPARREQERCSLAISQMWGPGREGRGQTREHTCFTFHYQLDESWFPHFQLYHYRYLAISAISYKIICLSSIIGFKYISVFIYLCFIFLISIISIHSKDYLSKQVSSNLINRSDVRAKCIESSMQNWGRDGKTFSDWIPKL